MRLMDDKERRLDRVRRMSAATETIARMLPDHISTPFVAYMGAKIQILGMGDMNRENVETAIALAETLGNVANDLDLDHVIEEIEHRTKVLGNIRDAAESVREDVVAYPSRWPGAR